MKNLTTIVLIVLALGVFFVPNRGISLLCFAAAAVLFFFRFIVQRSVGKTLVCNHCGHEMKLNTIQYMATFHEGNSYQRTCPKCGYKEASLKGLDK